MSHHLASISMDSMSPSAPFVSPRGSSYSPIQCESQVDFPDNGDLDDLPSIIQETQSTKNASSKVPFFKLPTLPSGISEAALAEGFIFQPRPAPKPGQYSISRPNLIDDTQDVGQSQHSQLGHFWYERGADLSKPLEPSSNDPTTEISAKDLQTNGTSPAHEQPQRQCSPFLSFVPKKNREHHGVVDMPVSTSPISHHLLMSEHMEQVKRDSEPILPPDQASSNLLCSSFHGRNKRSRYAENPSSDIGDLERPKPMAPARSPHVQRESIHSFRDLRGSINHAGGRESMQRPQSMNSNTSRKRSGVVKSPSRPGRPRVSEERQAALGQIMKYWNDCLLVADRERDQAIAEAAELQQHMAMQSQELHEAEELLRHKCAAIENAMKDSKKIQEERSRLSYQNESLVQQVEDLRNELSDSKANIVNMAKRYDSYKERLDKTIDEQQRMWKASQMQYGVLKADVAEEESKRIVESQRIEQALQLSMQKRVEMKQTFSEHQQRTEHEIQQSMVLPTAAQIVRVTDSSLENKIIGELEAKITTSETCSLREQGIAEKVLQEMRSLQLRTDQNIMSLQSKLDSFGGLAPGKPAVNPELVVQLSQK